MEPDKRNFIKSSGILSAGLLLGGGLAVLNSCSSKFVSYKESGKKFVVSKEDIAGVPYAMVKHLMLPTPVYVAKLGNDHYTAVLMECTHKRCELNPVGDILVCPCHDSEFSNTGKVLVSPAEEDLYKFKVTTDEKNIYIHIE